MRDALEHAGVQLAMGLAGALPEPAAVWIGRAFGRAAWRLGVRRRVALENIARAYGADGDPAAELRLGRASYEHLGTSFIEFLRLPRLTPATLRDRLVLDGGEHFRGALAGGRGAVVASGHLGNWELMIACVAASGFPATCVVQPLRNRRVEALVERVRGGAGIEVVRRGMALRRLRAVLAANRLLLFLCDQDARRRGVFVPFFDVPASTPKGAAQVAVRLGVPFIPAFGWREAGGRHRVVVHPPLAVPTGDEESAVRGLLAGFTARLEAAVRVAPEQYWWAHRRWKTRPQAAELAPVR
jgi:KDO2-lipid IV(A) lauroyltransferase